MGYKGAWDEFTDEEKKSVNFWLLNRYVSSVKGGPIKQSQAILKTNEFYNKKFNDIKTSKDSGHPKLLWQLLCISGNTQHIEYHPYIGHKKRKSDNNVIKILEQVYPNLKNDEVELLAKISSRKEIKQLAEDYGIDDVKL